MTTKMISRTHGTVHTVAVALTGARAALFPVSIVRADAVTEARETIWGHTPRMSAVSETDAPGSRKLTPGR